MCPEGKAYLGEGELNAPDLAFVTETVLAGELRSEKSASFRMTLSGHRRAGYT